MVGEFDKRVEESVSRVRADLEFSKNDCVRYERLYVSMKSKHEEMQVALDTRNKEFVEWRKAVNMDSYKDLSVQEHVERETDKLQARYESTISKLRNQVEDLVEENSKLRDKNLQASKMQKSELENEIKDLKLQIEVLKRSHHETEKLASELIKDKDRIQVMLKKESPIIFRRLQQDVFTEMSIYR